MRIRKADAGLLTGIVEADETYMGGKDRNRHASKKGTVPKMPVVGVTERSTGRVKAVVMPQPTCYTVQQWLQGAVSGTAILYSDQAAYYPGAAVAHHASVNHSRKEYVRGTGKRSGTYERH